MTDPWAEFTPASARSTAPVANDPWGEFAPAGGDADSYEKAIASPEGQKLAGELRTKADVDLLRGAAARGEGDRTNPTSAFLNSAANTALLNAPRNIAAGIRTLRGDSEGFSKEYDYLKSLDEAAERQSPLASGAGTLAGAVGQIAAVPFSGPATLAGRIAHGAAVGAGASGISEFADTKDFGEAAKAAGVGATLGGIAPPALEGVVRGVGAIGRGVAAPIRALVAPEREAARRVGIALERDAATRAGAQGGPAVGLDEAQFAAAQAGGQPVVTADLGGTTTRALARSSANLSPEARQAITTAADARFETQAPRVAEFIGDFGSGATAGQTREALQELARKVNRPAYQRAFAQGESATFTPELAQISQAPVVAEAIKGATRTGANKAAAEGFRPVKNPFDVLDTGEVRLRGDAVPTLQFWDSVKRNLDDKITAFQRTGEKEAARDAQILRGQLVSHLDLQFPAYREARAGAAQFFGAEDALEAGQKFVAAKGKNEEFARAHAKFSDPEKTLFADGFVNDLVNKVNETGDRRSVLNSIFNSPAAKFRVNLALGPAKAKELEAFLNIEATMDTLRNALGNSTTTRQLVELGLAGTVGGAGGAIAGGNIQSASVGAVFGGLAKKGKVKIDAGLAQKIGEMLSSPDPAVYRNALKMISGSPRLLDFIKQVDTKIVGAAGSAYQQNRSKDQAELSVLERQ
jgi:hypothetical protein